MALTLIGTTVWGMLAVYFGDSHSGVVQACVAAAFGLYGLATLIGLGFPGWRKRLLLGYSALFTALLLCWLFISPSNERQWQPDVAEWFHATFKVRAV